MKDKGVAIVLSLFLGCIGVDRFYLGYPIIGVIKLLTFGGFGVLWIVDLIRIITGNLKPKNNEYSAASVQACSDDLKQQMKGLVRNFANQGNDPFISRLCEKVDSAMDDEHLKNDD